MIKSGSKGKVAAVGEQNVDGKRVSYSNLSEWKVGQQKKYVQVPDYSDQRLPASRRPGFHIAS